MGYFCADFTIYMWEHLIQLGQQIIPTGSHVWLFGSRARKEAREDSDWDLLILLNKPKREPQDFEQYAMPFVNIGLEYNQLVSPHIYTYQEKYSFTPFYHNVEQDKQLVV